MRWMNGLRCVSASYALALCVAGCGDEDPRTPGEPDAAADPVALDVTVLVGSDSVFVEPRERDRECHCTGEFTPPGSCRARGDVSFCDCIPPPATCLRAVRVERAGVVVDSVPYATPEGAVGLVIPDLDTTIGNELVLDGCGGVGRVALPSGALEEPVITEISHRGEEATLHWEPRPPATGVAFVGGGFSENSCHGDDSGATAVPIVYDAFGPSLVYFRLVQGGDPVETEIGQVAVWQYAYGPNLARVVWPVLLDDGRIEIYQAPVEIEIESASPPPGGSWVGVHDLRADPLIMDLPGEGAIAGIAGTFGDLGEMRVDYQAGEVDDSLTITDTTSGRAYAGSFPHVAQAPFDVALGVPLVRDAAGYSHRIETGPVTLVDPTDESQTPYPLSLTLTVNLPTVSRPVP